MGKEGGSLFARNKGKKPTKYVVLVDTVKFLKHPAVLAKCSSGSQLVKKNFLVDSTEAATVGNDASKQCNIHGSDRPMNPILGSRFDVGAASFTDHRKEQHFVIGKPIQNVLGMTCVGTEFDGLKEDQAKVDASKPRIADENISSDITRTEKHYGDTSSTLDKVQRNESKSFDGTQNQDEKKRNLEMLKEYTPWGKPGGGAKSNAPHSPNRTGMARHEIMGNQGELSIQFPRFGKQGHGAPIRSTSGNLQAAITRNDDIMFQEIFRTNPSKAHQTRDGYPYPQQEIHECLSKLERLEIAKKEGQPDTYTPWGKPGSGAPLMNADGQLQAVLKSQVTMDKAGTMPPNEQELKARKNYLLQLRNEIDSKRDLRAERAKETLNGGEEVATWMRKRADDTKQLGPNFFKCTSEITANRMNIRRAKQKTDRVSKSDTKYDVIEKDYVVEPPWAVLQD